MECNIKKQKIMTIIVNIAVTAIWKKNYIISSTKRKIHGKTYFSTIFKTKQKNGIRYFSKNL